jgi:HAE1 family hydrophobic/amphiphilic exporter-1
MGTAVIGGMVAASTLAIFLIPVLFCVVEKLANSERRWEQKHHLGPGAPPPDGALPPTH